MAFQLPPIYLLSSHFEKQPQARRDLETDLLSHKALVWNIHEAHVVIGRVATKKRAKHELAKLGLNTEDIADEIEWVLDGEVAGEPPRKKRKSAETTEELAVKEVIALDDSTESDTSEDGSHHVHKQKESSQRLHAPEVGETIQVIKLEWYANCVKAKEVLPTTGYVVYEGRILGAGEKPKDAAKATVLPAKVILARAKADFPPPRALGISFHKTESDGFSRGNHGRSQSSQSSQRPHLHHETTSEHDVNIPPLPESMKTQYSCERATPANGPNDDFRDLLRAIKKKRQVIGDKIGIRSYNGAISTLNAYPYTITSMREIERLPHIGDKFSTMWQIWKETGYVEEIDSMSQDEDLKVLSIFFEIYDTGTSNAQKLFDLGYRDLDDVIQYHWDKLSRNQQIGIKFYDDFQTRIPRPEVEHIGGVVLEHANILRPGYQMVICGGYRRGRKDSGDVDVILSHPDADATMEFLPTLLDSLEDSGYVTHRLETSTSNSNSGQRPGKWHSSKPRSERSGFDRLDHTFVVWHEPTWPTMDADRAADPDAHPDSMNPNIRRRVDIIVSPWKTAGVAVIGWSGATMFERDLRSYCTDKLGYVFDSSGVTKDDNARTWVDLEGWGEGFKGDLLAKEKRVFSGLGLEWREPTERCTD